MPFTLFETDIGPCGIAWNDAGLVAVQLPEASRDETRERLAERSGEGEEIEPRLAGDGVPPWVRPLVADLVAHLAGEPRDLVRVPLDPSRASDFAQRVYAALREVGPGATTSYGELAKAAGSAGSARAVGRAMASNPWPVVVPCHRVLGKASAGDAPDAGGFSAYGGLVTKQKLLALEGVRIGKAQASLFDGADALPFDAKRAVEHLRKADPVLGAHIARVGELRLKLKETEGTFAALAESIVYQQLSGKAAATIFGRLRKIYPRGVLDPKRLLTTDDEVLRGAGLSRPKVESLRDLAARAIAGEVPPLAELARMDDAAIVERLTKVRGVGVWTVQMLLIFRLGRPDVLPVADLGVRKGFARVFRKQAMRGVVSARAAVAAEVLPTTEELTRRAARWSPFRSVASWYLWRALDTP